MDAVSLVLSASLKKIAALTFVQSSVIVKACSFSPIYDWKSIMRFTFQVPYWFEDWCWKV